MWHVADAPYLRQCWGFEPADTRRECIRMRYTRRPVQLIVVVGIALAGSAGAQIKPTNDAPNPYKTIEGWAKMPEGRQWGSTSAVEIAKDGTTIWVAERCGANSCAGSPLAPVLHFDANGNLIKAFGEGMIIAPHGIFVDRDGNVWVTDCSCTGGGGRGRGAGVADSAARAAAAQGPPKGHQVYKFSPDGQLLLTLGKAG